MLKPPLTIRQVEDLAADVADVAAREMGELRNTVNEMRSRRLRSDIELTHRAEKAEKERDDLNQEMTCLLEAQR